MKPVLAIAALLGSLAFACEREQPLPAPEQPPAASAPHRILPAEQAAAGAPLYDLEIALSAHDGRQIRLDEFRGKPVLVSMFYGSCPYACPALLGDVKRIERSLPPAAREELRILLVSFDPERDTPARLDALMASHGVDRRRWIMASASDADALSLAAALGIKYRRLPSGAFNHTSLITLLDTDGRIVAQSEGLGRDNAPIVLWLSHRVGGT